MEINKAKGSLFGLAVGDALGTTTAINQISDRDGGTAIGETGELLGLYTGKVAHRFTYSAVIQ